MNSLAKTPRLTKAQRYAIGPTVEDMPQQIPAHIEVDAIEVLKAADKRSHYWVHIASARAPKEIRNQWVVAHFLPDRAVTLREWSMEYWAWRQRFDDWEHSL